MKRFSRAFLALLLSAAALFLSACGSAPLRTIPQADVSPAGEEPLQRREPDPWSGAEGTFLSTYVPIENSDGRLLAVSLFTDRGFFSVSQEKTVIQPEPTLSPTPETGEEADGDEGSKEPELIELWEQSLYFTAYSGKTSRCEGFRPADFSVKEGHDSRVYLAGMDTLPDGNMAMVCVLHETWDGSPEGTEKYSDTYYDYLRSTYRVFLRVLDPKGREKSLKELKVPANDPSALRESFCPDAMAADGDGNIVIAGGGSLFVYSPKGKLITGLNAPGRVESLMRLSDGRVAAVVTAGASGRVLCTLAPDEGTMNAGMTLPENAVGIVPGVSSDVCYTVGTGFFSADADSGIRTAVFNWLNCGVAPADVCRCRVQADGTVINVCNTVDNDTLASAPGITSVKKSAAPADTRRVVTLSALSVDESLARTVIDFNRSSQGCRLFVKDYSVSDDPSDGGTGAERLLADIRSGQAGDVVFLAGLPYEALAQTGLLAELTPYLEKDKDAEDLLPNILSHITVDGQLYRTCASFAVETAAAPAEFMNGAAVCSYGAVDAALEQMPEDADIGDWYLTGSDVLKKILRADLDCYFDTVGGVCGFDSPEFRALLTFAGRFPATYDEKLSDGWDEPHTKAHRGRQVLLDCVIASCEDVSRINALYGEEGAVFTGYPSAYGSASVIVTEPGFALLRGSGNGDAAWEFLRSFFTEETQRGVRGIPTRRSVFEERLAAAVTPEYIVDEEGNIMVDEDDEPLTVSLGNVTLTNGDVVRWYEASEYEAGEFRRLAEETDKFACDEAVIGLVASLCRDCFASRLSVDDTARLVQSRMSALLSPM